MQGKQDREKNHKGALLRTVSQAKRNMASVQRIADAMSSVQGRPAESGAVSGGTGVLADKSDNVEGHRDNDVARESTSMVDMEVAVFKDLVRLPSTGYHTSWGCAERAHEQLRNQRTCICCR